VEGRRGRGCLQAVAGADKAGLTLEVQDLLQLLLPVRALRTLPGVSAVERV